MLKEEKVQFFNSESSFGSQSSLSGSRYFDLTNQIVQQTETIFHTLKRQFLPINELTNFDKIDYLVNRAMILSRDTIPDHLVYLKKIEAPGESRDTCYNCVQKLEKFIKDYEALKNGTMLHKQFYNLYGKGQQNVMLFKKDNNDRTGYYNGNNYQQVKATMLQPDVQSIQQVKSSRAKTSQVRMTQRHFTQQNSHSDKQIIQLQQEIVTMRRRQNDMRKQFQYMLTAQKLNCEKRVNLFLKALKKEEQSERSTLLEESYRNQIIRLGEEIKTVLRQKQDQMERNVQLQRRLSQMQRVNQSLRDQLIGFRRLQNSRMQDQQQINRSFQSQANNGNEQSRDIRKLTSQIKKLTSQRDILRSQLTKQRQSTDKQQQRKHSDQSREIAKLRQYLEGRNKENQELHRELDKARVELIQMKQQNKLLNKSVSTMKDTNEELKRSVYGDGGNGNGMMGNTSIMGEYYGSNQNNNKAPNLITFKNKLDNSKTLQKSMVALNPTTFQQYQGQGIQGYPYYQLLSKQFRIRFKRACLRPKQLLYKSNGLQIGVITEFTSPNCVRVLIHVTNSSQLNINSLKIKVMNPNDNRVECQIQQVNLLQPNQQVKLPITCTIKNYPIGPVVLAMDYIAEQKYDVRLLLPVHIFKCCTVMPRTEAIYDPTKILFRAEKKICKDMTALKEYLNCEELKEIKVQIKHQHSGSVMFLDARLLGDDIQLQYQHVSGMKNFTEYFVKTFKTLLQKQA